MNIEVDLVCGWCNMKRRIMKFVSVVPYALAVAVLVLYARMQFSSELIISPAGRIALLLVACCMMGIGGIILSKNVDEPYKWLPMRVNIWVWFGLYMILLFTLTLFDEYFGRSGSLGFGNWNEDVFRTYMTYCFNIIPFRTVIDMFVSVIKGSISVKMFLYNIVGNIAALMPTAFFLPNILKKQQNFKIFALTVTGIVAVIEIMQFITLSGAFDIDDFILNISGACFMFKLLEAKGGFKFGST